MSTFTQEEGRSGVLSYGLYKRYKKRFGRIDSPNKCDANVGYLTWLRICKKFNKCKMESIIKGHLFTMPFRLGTIGIIQIKKRIKFDENDKLITKGISVDWKKTYDLWKKLYPGRIGRDGYKDIKGKQVVYYTNEHTDGRIFKLHWKKKYCNIKNISAYQLINIGTNQLAITRYIRENNNVQYCTKF